ncbi:hypothetical protein J4208_01755 [Candidatus Woesearchaeota archaeon]|nr:hypothetical protein [Candidatus Woesearchaeota archaeon]
MQIATLVERIRKEEERIKICVVNLGRPEFIAGYVQQADVIALREEVTFYLNPYVQFIPHLGTLRFEEPKLLAIDVSDNHTMSYTFTELTTGFLTHRKITDKLMQQLLHDENCAHLPSRLKARQENYQRYLQLAQKL